MYSLVRRITRVVNVVGTCVVVVLLAIVLDVVGPFPVAITEVASLTI